MDHTIEYRALSLCFMETAAVLHADIIWQSALVLRWSFRVLHTDPHWLLVQTITFPYEFSTSKVHSLLCIPDICDGTSNLVALERHLLSIS